MTGNRYRPLMLAATCLIGVGGVTACSGDVESVSSTGTASAGAGTEETVPSAVAGSTETTTATVSPSAGGETAPSFETTIPDPNTSLPAPTPTERPTIPASGNDPAAVDCGILYRAAGWPTTLLPSVQAITCLQDAFDAGTPARLVDRAQTDGEGGAILVTTYDILGPGNVRVTVDAREAADRPRGITVSECTGLATELVTIAPSGCTIITS